MKSLLLVVLAACVLETLGISLFDREFDDEWEAWKTQHRKIYSSEEEEVMKRLTWQQNLDMIVKHNLEHQRGLHSYRLGMNAFGDMKHEEFTAFFNGWKKNGKGKSGSAFLPPENAEVPSSVDWRKKGYVTPVKDQMQCGSCWAFSTTGSLEGQHFRKTGQQISLSEQNLVDCSWDEGNEGCYGGFTDQAFQYVQYNGGIDTESRYPYVGMNMDCEFKERSVGATCTGYVDVDSGEEHALQRAVASVGPISVAIDASQMSFMFYESGVYNESYCSSVNLDHGVLVVGYDNIKGRDYWIVKNSWGNTWGMSGYIWMSRNKNNQCGIATEASFPLM